MNKKIVILGGGTGLSTVLRGLKKFPVDITAVVTVFDDGKSTGKLRQEFLIPAVGDIRRVIVALSETEPLLEKVINYRFDNESSLQGHSLGNLLLTGLINCSDNFSEGIKTLSKVLNLKGKVLPLTEDNIILKAVMNDGNEVLGEHKITDYDSQIKEIFYDNDLNILPEVISEIKEADLIVLSMGSLYTSIACNLISEDIKKAIDSSNAEIMYVCNMMTQPGESDGFKASDHVSVLNSYLGNKKIKTVVVNNGYISKTICNKYKVLEQKEPVEIDIDNLEDVDLILDDFVIIEDEMIKHNTMKLGFHIFAHLIK